MSTWLKAWRNRESGVRTEAVVELLVVRGVDAGSQFTLEGDEVLIGRGESRSGEPPVIQLEDKSISRRQVRIRSDESGISISHIEAASNPTLLNGHRIERARLRVGDRIEMGRVAIDVIARAGTNLRGLTEIMEGATHEATLPSGPSEMGAATDEESTEIRPMEFRLGELRLLRGGTQIGCQSVSGFPIGIGTTRIGRGEDVEVRIAEPGVSRLHAEIAVEGGAVVLRHKGRTNPTLLNGFPVLGSIELSDGDEIQLADRVVLGVELAQRSGSTDSSGALSRRMQNKIHLDRSIEEFNVMGTFLDIDVVSSRAMKVGSERPEHIIVSFERFRAYVSEICQEWDGQVLNSNGDELMCFFESAASAVLAGSAVLERLDEFNRGSNLLSRKFRFRLGAHTGVSLVDLDAGVAYSEVLDTAGHIQKQAAPNSLVISQATLDSLPRSVPVTRMAKLPGESNLLYRVDGNVHAHDLEGDSSN